MASILADFEYDIFISYRHKDNKYDGWVTEFVTNLKKELEATFKEDISIYFDENPHDGLLESHQVDESLSRKLKSLIFIPIISQTYCDTNCYAWQQEFISFSSRAREDVFGLHVQLANGNVASRVLPLRIHELNMQDQQLLEKELQGKLRCVDFIYHSAGVNRPLRPKDDELHDNEFKTVYRNQINKVANAIKSLIEGLQAIETSGKELDDQPIEFGQSKEIRIAEEIKKRDLVKVALVYSIVALVTWKTIELINRFLLISDNVPYATAIILFVFFPVALLLAWKFEKAPTGFIRSDSPAARHNPFSSNQKKPLTSNTAILALLVIMLLLYFLPAQLMRETVSASLSKTIKNKSIAVLYFDNLSGDPDQEYMSDGLTDEIITRLTRIDGLRVISRPSVRVYKGQPLNLKKIAEELNVDIVLVGSVRKSGNQLKITAQLIDAETDEHFWAETYNLELKDVFSVQTQIAEVIADKFEISMNPEVNLKVSAVSTPNTEAYECYLRARYIAFNQYYNVFDSLAFERSRSQYEKAIVLDPKFALAYAGLADLYDAKRGSNDFNRNNKEVDSLRHSLSRKAYQIDPNAAFVNNVIVWTLVNRDVPLVDSAFFHARKAFLLEPDDYYNSKTIADLLTMNSYGLRLHDLAIPFYKKAVVLNPLNADLHISLGRCYYITGDYAQAGKEFQTAIELAPSTFDWWVVFWLIENKRFDEAEQMQESLLRESGSRDAFLDLFLKITRGDQDAEKLLARWKGRKEFFYAALGRKKEAITELSNWNGENNWYLENKHHKSWLKFQNDPDYQKALAKRKLLHDEYTRHYGKYLTDLRTK